MRKLKSKLASRLGETLVETLVSILIVALASVAFLSMSLASGNVNFSAEKMNAQLRSELTIAETGDGETPGRAYIDGIGYNVYYSGGNGTLTSYTDAEAVG
ncbi:MAG: hypothetical protein VB112_06135 [Oscillospiraceae bacterium]|nr:hypothetical protein [Oscillospiraceae bacterium]